MTVTLFTSQSAPATADADALVTGVFQGQHGPVLTPGMNEIDLMAALTALGATGKAEEVTKVPTGGRLTAPVVVAVGLGPEPAAEVTPAERRAYLERLRRAAGAAARDLTAGHTRAGPACRHGAARGRAGRGRGGGARRPARRLRVPEVPGRRRGAR